MKQHLWGPDLSSSMQGAGGDGGLVAGTVYNQDATLCPTFDGNGNVTALVDSEDHSLAVVYEYDLFGNLLGARGDFADENPFRFSTKHHDDESGLVYYGYRFYDPALGRWLNRDPIGELGGLNLYEYAGNEPVAHLDAFGDVAVQSGALDQQPSFGWWRPPVVPPWPSSLCLAGIAQTP
jgi:RHS repeat-associated protein